MKRSYRARRLALQALCCLDAQGNKVWDLVEDFIADADEAADVAPAARALAHLTFDRRPECDAILARHARHWEMGRLAMVDRNVLRMGVAELLEGQTPLKVVITEALKLAREFSSAESPRFVNGVLDAVAKEIQKQNDVSRDAKDARDKNQELESDTTTEAIDEQADLESGDTGDSEK